MAQAGFIPLLYTAPLQDMFLQCLTAVWDFTLGRGFTSVLRRDHPLSCITILRILHRASAPNGNMAGGITGRGTAAGAGGGSLVAIGGGTTNRSIPTRLTFRRLTMRSRHTMRARRATGTIARTRRDITRMCSIATGRGSPCLRRRLPVIRVTRVLTTSKGRRRDIKETSRGLRQATRANRVHRRDTRTKRRRQVIIRDHLRAIIRGPRRATTKVRPQATSRGRPPTRRAIQQQAGNIR
jgi:hypothetical protein